ncbi:TolC family protein [Aneurinibacillus tyrosinisolvens]|uniref:TolC family protein n=1 Tax=Aneurinibacillus tyrosinisolvens TaxID=1443435 RepID=UPI00063F9B68|nr:TolC family protein [Aneurinibacillus tyrosinisolvens]
MKKKLSALLVTASLLVPYAVLSPAAYAAEQQKDQELTLTYQQAVERALNNSYTLKNSKEDIDRSAEVRDKVGENVKYTPIPNPNAPYSYDAYNQAANMAFSGFQKASVGYEISKKQAVIDEDTVVANVRKAYNDILQAQEQKKLADLTVHNDDMQRNITQIKFETGVSSKVEKTKADGTYNADRKSKEAAGKALEASYQKFDSLVGLRPEARPQLADQLTFVDMPDVDLESHITRTLSENPALWKANKAIELARLSVDLYMFNDKSNPDTYDAKKIDVTKAENTYADAKEQTAKALRTIYQSIRQIEDNYKGLQENVGVAEEGLRATQVQYDVGLATKLELSNAQLTVDKLKEKMSELSVQHDNLIQTFYKPWAGSAS